MDEKSIEIQRFTPKQRAFIRRWAAVPFLSMAATADAVNVRPQLVYDWNRNADRFREACDQARAQAQEDIGAGAEAALRSNLMSVTEAKISTALFGTDRERDSAQTWVLEHVLGKGEAVNKLDVTTGGKSLDDALRDLAGVTVKVALPDELADLFRDGDAGD